MIKVTDLAYVRFSAPDLDGMETFLHEFGMATSQKSPTHLYMRGTGPDHTVHITQKGAAGFVGLAFLAASMADLETFATENAVAIADRNEPGGGKYCRVTDPNGFPVEVVFGMEELPELPRRHDTPANTGRTKNRTNATNRLEPGTSRVLRLGHCAINVTSFEGSLEWYNKTLGLICSDEVYIGDESAVIGGFVRCDYGDRPVDHHTLFLVGTGTPGFGHAAFEVENLDDLMVGHYTLADKGRVPVWGVGRHALGSQIFDYWKDPFGHILEHWTDGDLFTADIPSQKNPIEALIDNQWGGVAPPAMSE